MERRRRNVDERSNPTGRAGLDRRREVVPKLKHPLFSQEPLKDVPAPFCPAAVAMWLLVFLMPVLAAVSAEADFFRYVGPDGHTVFVDDLGKVPPEFRPEAKRYREAAPGPDRQPVPNRDPVDPAARQDEEASEAFTPVFIQRNRVFVPVTLGYGVVETQALLVLDTGASVTTLHRNAAERLFMRGLDRTVGRTASGNVVRVELATLDYIQVGPHRKERHRIGIIDPEGAPPGYDGLLGMDFLAGLDFDIDFQRKALVWR